MGVRECISYSLFPMCSGQAPVVVGVALAQARNELDPSNRRGDAAQTIPVEIERNRRLACILSAEPCHDR